MNSKALRQQLPLLALVCFVSSSQASVFSDRASFESANPGLLLEDFEGFASPGGLFNATPAFAGFFVTGTLATPIVISDTFTAPSFPGSPSDFLSAAGFLAELQFSFTSSVNAVGFEVSSGADAGEVIVEVFNNATLLASETFVASGLGAFDTFVGFSDIGAITSLQVQVAGAQDFPSVDNFTFGTVDSTDATNAIPEPTMFLVWAGLACCCGAMRRRAIDP